MEKISAADAKLLLIYAGGDKMAPNHEEDIAGLEKKAYMKRTFCYKCDQHRARTRPFGMRILLERPEFHALARFALGRDKACDLKHITTLRKTKHIRMNEGIISLTKKGRLALADMVRAGLGTTEMEDTEDRAAGKWDAIKARKNAEPVAKPGELMRLVKSPELVSMLIEKKCLRPWELPKKMRSERYVKRN